MKKKEGASYIDFQNRHFYEERRSTKALRGDLYLAEFAKEWEEQSTWVTGEQYKMRSKSKQIEQNMLGFVYQ